MIAILFILMFALIGEMGKLVLLVPSNTHHADAFAFNHAGSTKRPIVEANSIFRQRGRASSKLWYTDTPDTLIDIDQSKIRDELESYGISTKSMYERRELEENLRKERSSKKEGPEMPASNNMPEHASGANGSWKTIREKWSENWNNIASAARKVVQKYATGGSSSDSFSTEDLRTNDQETKNSTSSPPSQPRSRKKTRRERYEIALDEGKSMRSASLRQELKGRGISTDAFFDKSDLVEAYANAVAYNLRSNDMRKEQRATSTFDPSYRDVIVHAFDPRVIMTGDTIIDITNNSN